MNVFADLSPHIVKRKSLIPKDFFELIGYDFAEQNTLMERMYERWKRKKDWTTSSCYCT